MVHSVRWLLSVPIAALTAVVSASAWGTADAPFPEPSARLERVDVRTSAGLTIVFQLSRPVTPHTRTLPADGPSPARIYLDLPDTHLGRNAGRPVEGAGPLQRVRIGQFDLTTVRVVLDLEHPTPFVVRQDGATVSVTLEGGSLFDDPPETPAADAPTDAASPPAVAEAPPPTGTPADAAAVPPDTTPAVTEVASPPPPEAPAPRPETEGALFDEPAPVTSSAVVERTASTPEPLGEPGPPTDPASTSVGDDVQASSAPTPAAQDDDHSGPPPSAVAAAAPYAPDLPSPDANAAVDDRQPPAPPAGPGATVGPPPLAASGEPDAAVEPEPLTAAHEPDPVPSIPRTAVREADPLVPPAEPAATGDTAAPTPPAGLASEDAAPSPAPAPGKDVTASLAPAPGEDVTASLAPAPGLEAPSPTPTPPESATPSPPGATASRLPPASHPIVVLDPGHGGRDHGAAGVGGILEKDVVLEVTRRLATRLATRLPVTVLMTRTDDSFMAIDERLAICGETAVLFLSLHANSCPDPSARGVELFYGGGSVRPASTRATDPRGALLGQCIADALRARVGSVRRDPQPGTFGVLARNTAPSVLVEIGFLTHAGDAALAQDTAYQELLADALVDGIAAFLHASAPAL